MKHFFIFLMTFATLIVAAESVKAQGGFFLKRTGLELGYRPGTDLLYKTNAPFYSKARIGGKIDNFFIGAGYIAEKSYYEGVTTGWTADLGYDINFGKGWGLNLALEYMAIKRSSLTTSSGYSYVITEDNVFWLPLYFYKQFNISKSFFIKPMLGLYGGYRNNKTTYYRESSSVNGVINPPTTNIYTSATPVIPYLHAGIGLGYNINKNFVLGAMPMYEPYGNRNVYSLQLSLGYNFYTQESFDGKAKR